MKNARKNRPRIIMFIVSLCIGVSTSIALSVWIGEFQPISVIGVMVVICIPSVWHLFLTPDYMEAKDYCIVVSHYLIFWGGPIMLLVSLQDKVSIPDTFYVVLVGAGIVLYAFGAFLKRR